MAISEPKDEQDRVAASDASIERGEVPDTARTYERAQPDKESTTGQLAGNQLTPDPSADDSMDEAVTNQKESRELTADDYLDQRDTPDLSKPGAEQGAAPQQSGSAPRGTAASVAQTKGTADRSDAPGTANAQQQQRAGQVQQRHQQNMMAQRPETADVTNDQPADDAKIAAVQSPPGAVTPDDIRERNAQQSQGDGPRTQQSQQNQARQGRDSRPTGRSIVDPPSGRDPSKPIGTGERAGGHDPSKPISEQPDHSMNDETPLGWDQAPTDVEGVPAGNTRHPRQGGKGGTPDVGEADEQG